VNLTFNQMNTPFEDALSKPSACFIALKSAEKKTAKNGNAYLRIAIYDGRELYNSTVFDERPYFKPIATGEWKPGDHFKVQGKPVLHPQYGKIFEIQQMRPVEDRDKKEGYKPDLLCERSPVDLDLCWTEVQETIASLKPEPLRLSVQTLFERHEESFRATAAAKLAHHAFFGGLMHHTVLMLREAKALMNVRDFPPMNESLVLAGILLHDLGKVAEMEIYPRSEYTLEGQLIAHQQIALCWLDEAAKASGFEGDLLIHLKHIILSHHGQPEFGAAVMPQTKEAMFVHLIDLLDSRLQIIQFALDKTDETSTLTEKLWALDNRAFRKTPPPA